jgi:hypothetical protein
MRKALLESRRKSEKKERICMFNNCTQKTIKSHVLQKNGILREISENNHLIQMIPTNPFETSEKGIIDFKLLGVNDVYTFQGFCAVHDSNLFKLIETESTINFFDKKQQALFCYRGLCQEIRRKEIATEWIVELKPNFPHHFLPIVESLIDGYEDGIENLNLFKKELENNIVSEAVDSFYFETIKIPKIELCISVPLNIGELVIPKDLNYKKWRQEKQVMPTSFVNVFPKENESYVIVGYHNDYPCEWTINFINKMKSGNKKEIFKQLSDLVTLRLEFWSMSQHLFNQIPQIKIAEFKFLFSQNVHNHSSELTTELNLFEHI